MPAINDDGFAVLAESHAIMQYLCEKYGWDDLYPSSDPQQRAKIHEYLHFTLKYAAGVDTFAAKVRGDLNVSLGTINNARRIAANTINILENHWLQDGRRFLVRGHADHSGFIGVH